MLPLFFFFTRLESLFRPTPIANRWTDYEASLPSMFPSWYGVGDEVPTAISHANALAGLVEISSYADAVEHPHLTNRDFGVIVPGPVAAKGLPSLGIAPVAAAPIDRFFLVVHMPYLAAVVGAVAPRLLPMPGTWHPIPLPMASIQSEDDVLECVLEPRGDGGVCVFVCTLADFQFLENRMVLWWASLR